MRIRFMLAPLLTIAAILALAATPAALASTFKLKETFGSAGQPSFDEPMALAVDQANGDLLVVDVEAKTISRFKADGTPHDFSALAGNVIDGQTGADETPQHGLNFIAIPQTVQVAVDSSGGPANGDIYVSQFSEHLVDIFAENGSYLGQLTASSEGVFGATAGVAVDPSGAVYVSQSFNGGVINKFVPAANPPVNGDNTANFARPSFGAVAAGAGSSAGSLFADSFGSEPVKLDSTTGTEQCVVTPGESVTITVDPADGHVFNATGSEAGSEVKEYSGACEAQPTPVASFSPGGGPGAGIGGIAVDAATGDAYVAREGSPQIAVWEPVSLPEAHTEAASAVGGESVVLHGTISAAGGPEASCEFQYTTTEAFKTKEFGGAASVPCSPAGPFAGNATESVSATVGGLDIGTEYTFRVVASTVNGAAPGERLGFQTLGPALREEAVTRVTASTATIDGAIDPNGKETSFFVEYIDAGAYRANPESDRFAGAVKVPVLEREVPVGVTGSGNLKEQSRIVTNVAVTMGAFGRGETISGPGIAPNTKIVSVLSANELELSQPAGTTVSGAVLSATGPQPVNQQLAGLVPGTTYHYRLVASDAGATGRGPDQQFTTFSLPGALLPDGRAYEMVSPSLKTGEVISPETFGSIGGSCSECLPGETVATMPMQSATDGESVLYEGQPFSNGLASGPNEYVAHRASNGWGSRSLSEPTTTGQYQAFSADLSRGVLFQASPGLSPEAPTRGGVSFPNLYLREGNGSLQPLVTEEPPHRDPLQAGEINQFNIRYVSANAGTVSAPAFGHVIFEANDTLTKEVPGIAPAAPEVNPGKKCALSNCDLYEWAGGRLRLVNVLPGNAGVASGAVLGSGYLLAEAGAVEAPGVDRAISADGSRIFWSEEGTGQVYVRIDGERTLEVPGPGSCKESVPETGRACFLTASADGSQVLLSDGQVYALDAKGDAYEPVVDLTEGHGGFQGILGAGEDLSRVYFVDTAVLTGGEENANNEHAETGGFNLYTWHGGVNSFIGKLLGGDNEFGLGGQYGAWHAASSDRAAQVTSDGSYLAFMSTASLTGYDSSFSGGGECPGVLGTRCFEVFVYSAWSGTLACASCNSSGQRPVGPSNVSLLKQGSAEEPPFPQPHNLSSDGHGRVFFESQDTLSPRDTNGHIQDVYEWEPNGVGRCARAGGCVSLISSGHSPNDSMFVDSTPSGDDAFFITRERLVSQDKDEQLDLYDARADGGIIGGGETAPCGGETCKGPLASPPSVQVSASTVFSGVGNFALVLTPPSSVKPRTLSRAQKLSNALRACAKKPKRKQGSCRALARKRYGPTRAKTTGSRTIKGGK